MQASKDHHHHPVASLIQQLLLQTALQLASKDSALQEVMSSFSADTIPVEHPADALHGDYSSTISLVVFAKYKQLDNQASGEISNPRALATKLVSQLNQSIESEKNPTYTRARHCFKQIEIAGPGFINFVLSEQFLLEETVKINQEKFLFAKRLNQQRIMIEFTDPNPFKQLHIGHAYSNTVGEALCRLFEVQGATLQRVCYQGDVGMHVAKSVWGMLELLKDHSATTSINQAMEQLAAQDLSHRVAFLGKAYAKGATAYSDGSESTKAAIQSLNYLTYRAAQEELESQGWEPQVDYQQYLSTSPYDYQEIKYLYQTGRRWSLEYFESMYQRLGMSFDDYYFESQVGELGTKIVREYLKKGVFQESQGAIIFPGSKYDLHDRVFINSLGLPTYEAKELGLAPHKQQRWPYDRSIIITGNEIDEYFKVLLCALEQIEPELAAKTTHLSHAMVRLPAGKMSSRTGSVITAEWLLDEVEQRIRQIMAERKRKHTDQQAPDQEVVSRLGLAAVKFAFLKSSIGKDIAFDLESSVSFQGKSGPYVLYSLVRVQNIFGTIAPQLDCQVDELVSAVTSDELIAEINLQQLTITQPQRAVLSLLYQYQEVVPQASQLHAPHLLAEYLYELAQQFNVWYDSTNISAQLDQTALLDDLPDAILIDLQLVLGVKQVLSHGLTTLGIPLVTTM